MNDKEINSKLANVIILLHECGYDRDYIVCKDNYRIMAVGEQLSYSPAEAGLSLINAFYHDISGLSTAIFTVSTFYGDKGILLVRHNPANAEVFEKVIAGHLMASGRNARQLKR